MPRFSRLRRRLTARRDDLVKKLGSAVWTGTVISDCHRVPRVGEAREIVNDAIRELGG
jgi:hypothetical protein